MQKQHNFQVVFFLFFFCFVAKKTFCPEKFRARARSGKTLLPFDRKLEVFRLCHFDMLDLPL